MSSNKQAVILGGVLLAALASFVSPLIALGVVAVVVIEILPIRR